MIFDVVIIGAGVVGGLIARELSKNKLNVAILEKESDVASGTSKGNSAIVHAGFDAKEGSLKAKLNVLGCEMMENLADELNVPYKKNGSLICAFDGDEKLHLDKLCERAFNNNVKNISILSSEEVKKLEPNLSHEIVAALYAPDAGIVCPYKLTVAAIENAVDNGVKLFLNCKVLNITKKEDFLNIECEDNSFKTNYIINSAGLFSDEIAALTFDNNVKIMPRRGEYMLLDKNSGKLVSNTIFSVPSVKGKGVLVSPTVDGNLILGPNADLINDKNDKKTTAEGLQKVKDGAIRLVPKIELKQVITSFSGIRSTPANNDFNIFFSNTTKKVLHLVGIESPGLASSPAIAKMVVKMLTDDGLKMVENPDFNGKKIKKKSFYDMDDVQKSKAILENNLFSKIICRCEMITEAEIVNAIHSSCPAKNVDAVKRRTRAGMGRCQGGFCSSKVVEILSRELNISPLDVTKKGRKSFILTGKTKT